MSEVQDIIGVALVMLGIAAMFIGSVGILRLPDFFSRSHAVSMSDTLGIALVILGLVAVEGFTQSSLKLLLVLLFVAISNPIGIHALGRAALRKGIKPLLTGKKEDKP